MIETDRDAREWLQTLAGFDDSVNARLHEFAHLLAIEASRQNLIARSTLGELWRRHIADSAQLLSFVSGAPATWLDLGSGAGFPGMICAIFRSGTRFELVESRPLRARWLARVSSELSLVNVTVTPCRLERSARPGVDVISARAFAPLDRLIALSARFSTSDTLWLLPKGRSARDELDALRDWRHEFHVEQSLTDANAGIVVGKLIGQKDKRG